MKLMRAKEKATIMDKLKSRAFNENLNPPKVNPHANIIKQKHIEDAISGEITQLDTIRMTLCQLTSLAPKPARAVPTSALMTVWVPLIGMPNRVEHMMKQKDAIDTASIILV